MKLSHFTLFLVLSLNFLSNSEAQNYFVAPQQLSCRKNGNSLFVNYDIKYNELLDSFYNKWVSERPDYVSKVELGMSSNNQRIYAYYFTPLQYSFTLILNCLHGQEKYPVFAVARFLKYLIDGEKNELYDYLRNNVRIIVIPHLDTHGFDQTGKIGDIYIGRNNANGVNLNRNFEAGWQKAESPKGKYVFSEPESKAMKKFLEPFTNKSDVFLFDMHNTFVSNYGYAWFKTIDPLLGNDIKAFIKNWTNNYQKPNDFTMFNSFLDGSITKYASEILGIKTLSAEYLPYNWFKGDTSQFFGAADMTLNFEYWSNLIYIVVKNVNQTRMISGTDDIKVYPNPTTGKLYIENILIDSVKIYNVLGVNQRFSFENSNRLNLKDIPNGLYYLIINNTYKKLIFKK